MSDNDNLFGDMISSYSRADAIADGVLVDLSHVARAAQYRVPVAISSALWARCIETPARVSPQAELLWTWKLLYRVHWAIQVCNQGATRIDVELEVADDEGERQRVRFLAAMGPGDDGEPVMTLMFHDED